MDAILTMDEDYERNEEKKIEECLKKADSGYYHRIIQNRISREIRFPHMGEDGSLFINTFQYVNLFKKITDK